MKRPSHYQSIQRRLKVLADRIEAERNKPIENDSEEVRDLMRSLGYRYAPGSGWMPDRRK